MMKKLTALLMVVIMALSFTACGKFVCGLCGQEKFGKKHEKNVLGYEIVICNDCQKDIDSLFS